MSITQDDLLDALRAAMDKPALGQGSTSEEIAAELGFGPHHARKLIKKLLASGEMEVVTVERKRMDGVLTKVSGYRKKYRDIFSAAMKRIQDEQGRVRQVDT